MSNMGTVSSNVAMRRRRVAQSPICMRSMYISVRSSGHRGAGQFKAYLKLDPIIFEESAYWCCKLAPLGRFFTEDVT